MLTSNRCIHSITLSAFTVSPLDHFQGLIVTVTDRPSADHSGGCARLRSKSTSGLPLLPNQYSGRYISIWNSKMFRMPNSPAGVNGKMTVGGKPGVSAQVAVPPRRAFPRPLSPALSVIVAVFSMTAS